MFDIRRIQVHSLRDFAREYLMIVLGILTALGLEHLASNVHEERLARESQQQVLAEIRLNLEEIRGARQQNADRIKPMKEFAAALKKDIEAGVPRERINRRIVAEARGHIALGYVWPTLRHDAWDTAIANQSVLHMDPEVVRRYTAAYAAQRDASSVGLQAATALLNTPRVMDVATDLEFSRADPLEFMKVLRSLMGTLGSINVDIEQLQTELEKALAGAPAAEAGPAPHK